MNVSFVEAVSVMMPSCADASPASRALVHAHGALAGEARQRRRIENQHHAAVAQIGRTRYAFDLDQRIGNRSHDDFTLTDDPIDGETDRRRAVADDEEM